MRKISKKYAGVILGILLPITMGFIMSFIATAINLGFADNFLSKWMQAYLGVLVFGLPVGFIITPPLKALVGGSGRTEVVLTEKGWEMFASDRRSELMSSHRQGWNYHLSDRTLNVHRKT